jgi:nitrite reductase (NADH) small subunit
MRNWHEVCRLEDIPPRGSRVVPHSGGSIAVFRATDDTVFALRDACPHKGGPLSQGIVHGHRVTCPLHGWHLELASGEACAPDNGRVDGFAAKVAQGVVLLALDE